MERNCLPSASVPGRCLLLAAAVFAPVHASGAALEAQLVDRGTFRILVNGREVGSEQFTIQRLGTGAARTTVARGTVSMHDGRRLDTLLEMVGPELFLAEYAARETGADTLSVTLSATGNRLRTRTTTGWGHRVRGYRARPATFVLDDGVAHHYFVLGEFTADDAAHSTLHVFSRVSEGLETVEVAGATPESIELGGERIEVTRIDFGSGDGAGSAWFDGSGRLVRVSLPGRGFVAVRDL